MAHKETPRYFRHFKGKYYRLLHIAHDSETLESMVVYQALYGEYKIWVRPEKMFFEEIERDGKRLRRFEEVPESEIKSLISTDKSLGKVMAKNTKEAYKVANEQFLAEKTGEPGVKELTNGILYKVLNEGKGKAAAPNSVVAVYYKGSLINGKTFDDNTKDKVPAVFRLRDLIVGWQIALRNMREGDRWQIFIPAAYGYGSRGVSGIPGNSTLIFDIKLVKVN